MNSPNQVSRLRRILPWAAVLCLPTVAHAHVGLGHTHGLLAGAGHPLTGLDHLCAMIAVGLWAAQRGGRSLWLVPATFVSIMGLGAVLGVFGVGMPWVEPGVAASVLVLGILIASAARLPLVASAGIVGVFALLHGHAHGTEMAPTESGLLYGIGFVVVTALLHAFGIGLGCLAGKCGRVRLVRYAGGAIAACGVWLCLAT